jgi:hypothetical protein
MNELQIIETLACNIHNLSYEEYLHIKEHISQTRESIEAEYEHLGLEIPNKYFDVISFIAGHNYKASTKKYSEEDMIGFAEWIADSKLHGYAKQLYEAMIRHKVKTTKELLDVYLSLKQP